MTEITNLSSALSSAELSAFDEAGVPIRPDDPVVQPRSVDVPEKGRKSSKLVPKYYMQVLAMHDLLRRKDIFSRL